MSIGSSHWREGISVHAWLVPTEEEFIGPLMNLGPAFLLMEREYLQELAMMMACEAHMLLHTDLGEL